MITHAAREFPAHRLTRGALAARAIFVIMLVATGISESCAEHLGFMTVVRRSATAPVRDARSVASESR